MSDDLNSVLIPKPQAGQPAPASETVESSGGMGDAEKLAALIDERLENFSRKQQSQLDKLEARVKKQVNALRTAGVEPTADMVNAIRQAVTDDEPISQQPSAQKPAQVKAPETKLAGWREAIRDDLYKKYGIELAEGDPELATVKAGDSEELTDSLRDALKTKKARTEAQERDGAQGRLGVIPAGGSTNNNPIQDIRDPADLIRMGLTKK